MTANTPSKVRSCVDCGSSRRIKSLPNSRFRMPTLTLTQRRSRTSALLFLLHIWIGAVTGCLPEGGDYNFSLRLEEKSIRAAPGCALIPCGFSAPLRILYGRQVWFKGSTAQPLGPEEAERKKQLLKAHPSTHEVCSVLLWDLSGENRTEEFGFMLESDTEKHIFDERVKVSFSAAKLELAIVPQVLVAGEKSFLACTLDSVCTYSDPKISWKGLRSRQRTRFVEPHKTNLALRYSDHVIYTPVPEDHQAEVTCEATFGKNLTASAKMTLTVLSRPQILNSSGCTLLQDLLTCVCVSQGHPRPAIEWSLQNNIDFTAVRTLDGHITVKSSITLNAVSLVYVRDVVCVSRNSLGQTNTTLPMNVIEGKDDLQDAGQPKNNLEDYGATI